jgi:DNA-binding MarR family transcriptional regulator
MLPDGFPKPDLCNCLALRQAARHVTQFYDQFLVPTGLRTSQFGILAKLRRIGPMTINALAKDLVMDRTTLGRNILPLEREGLIAIKPGKTDRRSKELHLTEAGLERLRAAAKGWAEAQKQFEASFGNERSAALRAALQSISASDLGAGPAGEDEI